MKTSFTFGASLGRSKQKEGVPLLFIVDLEIPQELSSVIKSELSGEQTLVLFVEV